MGRYRVHGHPILGIPAPPKQPPARMASHLHSSKQALTATDQARVRRSKGGMIVSRHRGAGAQARATTLDRVDGFRGPRWDPCRPMESRPQFARGLLVMNPVRAGCELRTSGRAGFMAGPMELRTSICAGLMAGAHEVANLGSRPAHAGLSLRNSSPRRARPGPIESAAWLARARPTVWACGPPRDPARCQPEPQVRAIAIIGRARPTRRRSRR